MCNEESTLLAFAKLIGVILAIFLLVTCAGCTTVAVETMHVSHPLKGYPFGAANEEDTLDVINLTTRKEYGRMYIEQSLGYRYLDGGFYGDDFIYTGRVGVMLWDVRK